MCHPTAIERANVFDLCYAIIHDHANYSPRLLYLQVITRGSMKIYPAVVEKHLTQHPAISAVCVVAVPDQRLQNDVCACVVTKNGCDVSERDLHAYYTSTAMNDEGIGMKPTYFLFVDKLPVLNGKTDRKKMASWAAHTLINGDKLGLV